MRAAIIAALLVVASRACSQAIVLRNGEPMFVLSENQAANIDYWARKGVASEPLINSMEIEMKLLSEKIGMQDLIINNNKLLIGSCTQANDRLARENQALMDRLRKAETDVILYKDRSQRRGQTIGIMIGAAAAIVTGAILLN